MSARVLGASPKVVGIPKDPTNCVGVVSTFIPVQSHRRANKSRSNTESDHGTEQRRMAGRRRRLMTLAGPGTKKANCGRSEQTAL